MSTELDWYDLNIRHIEQDIAWFTQILELRLARHFGQTEADIDIDDIPIPELEPVASPYSEFVVNSGLSPAERLLLILALLPYIRPQVLDMLLAAKQDKSAVTEFGGQAGQGHRGFLPTAETGLFILSGSSLRARFFYQRLFSPEHRLMKGRWLRLEQTHHLEPHWSSLLLPSRELVDWVTLGQLGEPEFGQSFPAQKIETNRDWNELVLPNETMLEVQDILHWIQHEKTVMSDWGLAEKVMPGFRCLFFGPPGTGKTFTATLLGKATGREVYRIDLSMVVSKYIGETEKNLKNVFDKAQSRQWILFFDEADALFGKRTDVSDSKDRYANQEVSYLLQRVENFDGVVILATNNRENLDKAFTRRFQMVVNFPMPAPAERLAIWRKSIPPACPLSENVNMNMIAERYELAGGHIMNVIRHGALKAAKRGLAEITEEDLIDGIKKEYRKSGRLIN